MLSIGYALISASELSTYAGSSALLALKLTQHLRSNISDYFLDRLQKVCGFEESARIDVLPRRVGLFHLHHRYGLLSSRDHQNLNTNAVSSHFCWKHTLQSHHPGMIPTYGANTEVITYPSNLPAWLQILTGNVSVANRPVKSITSLTTFLK